MAKDLPYFKFDVSEYINGNITLEDFYTQGVFINVCAFYWFRSGKVTLSEIKRRLSKVKPAAFEKLIQSDLIKVTDDKISISFLDEQLHERVNISVTNSQNGKLGGRPKKTEEKPTALIPETETIPKKSNIEGEESREEKKRKEERETADAIFSDELFVDDLDRNHKGKDYRAAFHDCWMYHSQGEAKFEGWEWRKKLISWLSKVPSSKNGTYKNRSKIH